MSKNKSIAFQVKGILKEKLAIGESRHKSKLENAKGKSEYIHSWSTYNNYVKSCTNFGEWVKENYGEKNIKNDKKYVAEYIKFRLEKGCSAWTVSLDTSALAKLYGCSSTDFGVKLPERKRGDVKRSRSEIKDFSEKKHQTLVNFCLGTGLRHSELENVRKKDVFYNGTTLFVYVRQGKGGKERNVPVIEKYEKEIWNLALNKEADKDKLFDKKDIPKRLPAHKYRAMYAKAQYNAHARKLEDIPIKERYICRKDKAGTVYDKLAMADVSKMLGHNRIDVIAQSYLY